MRRGPQLLIYLMYKDRLLRTETWIIWMTCTQGLLASEPLLLSSKTYPAFRHRVSRSHLPPRSLQRKAAPRALGSARCSSIRSLCSQESYHPPPLPPQTPAPSRWGCCSYTTAQRTEQHHCLATSLLPWKEAHSHRQWFLITLGYRSLSGS